MTRLGRTKGIPNVRTGTPTTRTTVLLPNDLRAWVDGYSEITHQSITAIVIRLLSQERQQIDGAIGQEGGTK